MARKIEVAILTGVFITIASCFSIPIIIYATSFQDNDTDADAEIIKLKELINVNDCPQQVRIDNS